MLIMLIGITLISAFILIYRIDRLQLFKLKTEVDVPLVELETSINQSELLSTNLRSGTEKRIHWFEQHQKTDLSVLYIHGLSASGNEISPIPESIAKALNANLYLTRLAGHGGNGQSLASARAEDWLADFEQSWGIATSIGQRVVIVASSTGATLVECFLEQLVATKSLVSLIYLSPNFGVRHPLASISSWPFSQYWLEYILGKIHKGTYENELQQQIWTYNYPVTVFRQMQRLIDAMYRTRTLPIEVPALVFLCNLDEVVSSIKTQKFVSRYHLNGSYSYIGPKLNTRNHVITGNAMRLETNQRVINEALASITNRAQ